MEVPATDPSLAPIAGKTHREEGTFITSVAKARKDLDVATLPNGENITSLYGQLNTCISVRDTQDLDHKVENVLKKHEADFLNVYRGHMFNVQKEMRMLKEKASEEENKRRRDEELVKMEQERDWFRNEAVRLDKICKGEGSLEYKKSVEKWKSRADALEEDRKFLEDQVLGAKKLNLRAREQLELYHKTYGLIGSESKIESPSLSLDQSSRQEDLLAGPGKKVTYQGGTSSSELQSPMGEGRRVVGMAETQYVETINHLKSQLEAERRNLRQIKSAKTNYLLEKGELEDFFLQCIEEVRKEILTRRMKSAQLLSRNASKVMTRSSSARHFPKAAVPESADDIKLEMFTDSDKRKVIELLVSNEQVLLFLHQSLFPQKREPSASQSRLQEVSSAQSLNPTNRSGRVTSATHGLRSHVFSVPNLPRPSTAPIKPKAG